MAGRFAQFRESRRTRSAGDVAPKAADVPSEGPTRPALVVGLGNPEERYASTRHNVGVWVIRELARRHSARLEREKRMDVAMVAIGGHELHLGRPRAYVNESGPPIAAELRRLGLRPEQLLVLYDDLDLPLAQVRIRAGGGHGGNNGMRSIIAAVGTREFARIRVGIDRPYDAGVPVRDPDRVASWVLSAPGGAERERLHEAAVRAADAVETAVREGLDISMNRFNPGGPGQRG